MGDVEKEDVEEEEAPWNNRLVRLHLCKICKIGVNTKIIWSAYIQLMVFFPYVGHTHEDINQIRLPDITVDSKEWDADTSRSSKHSRFMPQKYLAC